MRIALIVVGVLGLARVAGAHIAMTSPAPRTTAQKTGPCGAAGSTRGTKVTAFRPGETITMTWTETVDHPGHYRIAFDDDGDDVFVDPRQPDDDFAFTLVDRIADRDGGTYSQQVTLPATPCTNCTLQLMQVMTTAVPYDSFYWQCADITIAGDSVPPDETSGGCATTPGPAGTAGGIACCMVAVAMRRKRDRSVGQRARRQPTTTRFTERT